MHGGVTGKASDGLPMSIDFVRVLAAHTGQSSQLPLDANGRGAQSLSNLAGVVVWHTQTRAAKSLEIAHSGQSSQFFIDATMFSLLRLGEAF